MSDRHVPEPRDDFPGVVTAAAGPLHVDQERLTRALAPLRQRVEELQGSGRGGVADFSAKVGGASGGRFGQWMTADHIDQFHGAAMDVHQEAFGRLLDQLLRVIGAAEQCAANVGRADAQSAAAFADAATYGTGPLPGAAPVAPVAPVGPDGGW